jgi:small conductance mechanosensitive channel
MSFLEQFDLDLGVLLSRLVSIAVVFIIGRWLAGVSRRWLAKSLQKYEMTDSIITLVGTLVYYSILLGTFAIVLGILGVPPNIIAGAIGIIVIVLAITLQASLGNLAATVNFLLFKPFVVGDIIQTAGMLGAVQEIQLFNTVIVSADHKTHILPNGKIQGAGITNLSTIGTTRVDQAYRISYASDVKKAKQIVTTLLADDERVLAEPAPQVFASKLAEDHIEITAWPFVLIADFLPFQKDIVENVLKGFEEAGIIIPLPQQEVRLLSGE